MATSSLILGVDTSQVVKAQTDLKNLAKAGDEAAAKTTALGSAVDKLPLAKAAKDTAQTSTNLQNAAKASAETASSVNTLKGGLDKLNPFAVDKVAKSLSESQKAATTVTAPVQNFKAQLDKLNPTPINKVAEALTASQKAATGTVTPLQNVATKVQATSVGVGLLGRALAALSIAKLAKDTLSLADSFQATSARLNLVTTGTGQLAQIQDTLFKTAQKSRSSYEGTVDLYTSLTRSTETFGASQKDVITVVDAINKSFAISNTNAQSAAAALLQLNQAFASGTLRGEELNSVLEQSPALAQAIANGLGVTTGKLKQLGQEGKLTAEQVFNAIRRSAPEITSQFEKIPVSIGGALTQAGNSIENFVGTIDTMAGATKVIAKFVSDSSLLLDQFTEKFKESSGNIALAGAKLSAAIVAPDLKKDYADLGKEIDRLNKITESGTQVSKITAQEREVEISRLQAKRAAIEAEIGSQEKLNQQKAIVQGDTSREDQRFEQAKKANIQEQQRQEALKKFLKDNGTAAEKFAEAVKEAKDNLGNLYSPEVEKRLKKKFLEGETPDFAEINVSKIQSQLQSVLSSYSNTENILEANHAALLIRDKDYYQQKNLLIEKTTSAQVKALQLENSVLSRRTDNLGFNKSAKDLAQDQEKIAENNNKISQLRAESVAKQTVLSIQEKAAADLVKKGYEEAEASAQAYLDTLQQAQRAELLGAGIGERERQRRAGLQQIEDKYIEQRRQLETERRNGLSQEQYQEELARIERFKQKALLSYNDYYSERTKQERDFTVGINEAYANYLDEVENVAKQTETLFTNAFHGVEDTIAKFITTGKLDIKSFVNSVIADLARIQARQTASNLISNVFSFFGNTNTAPSAAEGSSLGAAIGGARAIGGPVSSDNIYRVNEKGPELLNVAGKQYLMTGDQGGSITPAGYTISSNPVINIDARADQAQVAQMVRQGVEQGNAALLDKLARGGTL